MSLSVEVQSTAAGDAVVSPRGEIDATTVGAFRDRMCEALGRRPCRLEVDLALVTFVDSAGLAALVAAHRQARQVGAAFVLANPSTVVHRMLRQSGLLAIFDVHRWQPGTVHDATPRHVPIVVEVVLLADINGTLRYRVRRRAYHGDGAHPDEDARAVAGLGSAADGALLRQAGWRYENGHLVLTYVALSDPRPDPTARHLPVAGPASAEPLDADADRR